MSTNSCVLASCFLSRGEETGELCVCVCKDCFCLSSTTAVEGKFGQPKKHWVWFRPGAMGAEHYYPTAGNLAGLTSSCLHPSFSQQEYFEPAPNGSLSSYLRSL